MQCKALICLIDVCLAELLDLDRILLESANDVSPESPSDLVAA